MELSQNPSSHSDQNRVGEATDSDFLQGETRPERLRRLGIFKPRPLNQVPDRSPSITVFLARMIYQAVLRILTYFSDGVSHETQSSMSPEAKCQSVDPQVMKLLIVMVYTATYRGEVLDDCPFKSWKVRKILDDVPPFTEPFTTSMDCFESPEPHILLSWICHRYGSLFKLAEGKFAIPSFGSNVLQFIVQEPPKHEEFVQALAEANEESVSLFHGTALHNLESILRVGLKPPVTSKTIFDRIRLFLVGKFHPRFNRAQTQFGAGIWMSEVPTYLACSCDGDSHMTQNGCPGWKNSPLGAGVLFGCEVAGNGRQVPDGPGTHVITDLSTIGIRYVFVTLTRPFWWAEVPIQNDYTVRLRLKKQMEDAFKGFPHTRKVI